MLESGNDLFDGGEGSDWLQVASSRGVRVSLMSSDPQDTGSGVDRIVGIENLRGGLGNDFLDGNGNANRIEGGAGDDSLRGMNGSDSISGGEGNDQILCDLGDDIISGGAGDDLIRGAGGKDVLNGSAGADRIRGGLGQDIFWGGNDRDRDAFIFGANGVSKVGANHDVIEQFVSGIDRIDLSEIDAVLSTVAQNEAFGWAGTRVAAHSAWWQATSDGVLLRFDQTGDKLADFEVLLHGVGSLSRGDVLL